MSKHVIKKNWRFACIFAVVLLLLIGQMVLLSVSATTEYRQFQQTLNRKNYLITSHDPNNYTEFTIENNQITYQGKYTDWQLEQVFLAGGLAKNYKNSHRMGANGVFSGSLSGDAVDAHFILVVAFRNGQQMHYRIEYDNGWFFGDNGLQAFNENTLKNHTIVTPDAAAQYLSATVSRSEINDTLDTLHTLASEITAGLDNDYDKAKAISHWVSDNSYYDHDASEGTITMETVAIASVLKSKRTICSGYANLFCALAEAAGLEAVTIDGSAIGDGSPYETLTHFTYKHEFAAFWYEAQARWVYIDTGWDSGNHYQNGQYQETIKIKPYFDMSGLALSFVHRADKAELREYTKVPAYLDAQNTGANTEEAPADIEPEDDTEDAAGSAATEPPITPESVPALRSPEDIAREAEMREETDVQENMILYLVIGGMALLIFLLAAYLIIHKIKHK